MRKKEPPKISVIMPSYNVASYIRQCMDSVLSQTLFEIEILSIDAGSTDGTLDILEEYANKDDRIRVIKSEKKSYGYQMNVGIREASGEYIGIVETDDYVDKSTFKVLYDIAIRHNADIVKSGRFEVFEYANDQKLELPVYYYPQDKSTNQVIASDEEPSVHRWENNIWNAIYRSAFLKEHEIFFRETPGAAFQDIGFFHLTMNEAKRVVYLRNPLYHYRKIRPGASTWNPNCLHYFCNEYRRLIEGGRIKDSHLKSVYLLMLPAMLVEIDKVLCFMDLSKMDDEYSQDIGWFLDEVRKVFAKGIIRPEELEAEYREKLLLLMADRELYLSRYRRGVAAFSGWLKELRQRKKGRKLIIFGAGNYGMVMFQVLIRNGIRPEAFIDNNMWLRNHTVYGLPILTVDEAAVQYSDNYFLICSRNCSKEMKEQLVNWNIPEEQIGVFDGHDQEMVNVMRTLPVLAIDSKIEFGEEAL